MARHFLSLYLLIIVTLAAVSWGQDRLLDAYDRRAHEYADGPAERAVLSLASMRLRDVAPNERARALEAIATASDVDLELFDAQDIAGGDVLRALQAGERAVMSDGDAQTWVLQKLSDSDQVLAFKYATHSDPRSALEWALVAVFYAAIAFVLMLWLWPLRRDLRELERSTTSFGDRNWRFESRIGPRSQVHALAEAFRRMASRIDALISSHKDFSNAMSHEIKTPLARMRFEIEMARSAEDRARLNAHLDHLNRDIGELNAFVTATLDYAILERAELALNLARHDFTHILPAVVESVRRSSQTSIDIGCDVAANATHVECDVYLLETVVRNLLHNAVRYARTSIRMTFAVESDDYVLRVEDDGPGIPPAERQRVFESFVQLERPSESKVGYGLGLAIVRRAMEWHGGTVIAGESDLGGACFEVRWPTRRHTS